MYTVSPLFNHYPAFMFAILPDGTRDLWIASAHTADELIATPESLGAKVTREHMQACRSYYRRTYKVAVEVVLVAAQDVTFTRSRNVPLSPKVEG